MIQIRFLVLGLFVASVAAAQDPAPRKGEPQKDAPQVISISLVQSMRLPEQKKKGFDEGLITRLTAITDISVGYQAAEGRTIDPFSFDAGDLEVIGPNGRKFSLPMVGWAVRPHTEPPTRKPARTLGVSYRLYPPNGTWEAADNGVYEIHMRQGEQFEGVKDDKGTPVPKGLLTTFTVRR